MGWKPKTPYRKNTPLGLALPGGFVDVGESVEDTVIREMKEEISLDIEISYSFSCMCM